MNGTTTDPGPAGTVPTATEPATLLALHEVTRTFHPGTPAEVRALRGVTTTLAAGELVAVTGASGSGKSTLLHLAGGLDLPDSGRVFVEGEDVGSLGVRGRARLRRRAVGYVFQQLNLVPALTAIENVALPRELDGVRARTARAEAAAALEEVGVADVASRYPDELSGGQQQRIAIARALVGPRRLLLADEPTGALDSLTGEEIMRILRARADAGAGVLMVTHDPAHAAWADRIVRLRDGTLTGEGAPS